MGGAKSWFNQERKCLECCTCITAHTEGPAWFVMWNMCNDDWNIDHRRGPKKNIQLSKKDNQSKDAWKSYFSCAKQGLDF